MVSVSRQGGGLSQRGHYCEAIPNLPTSGTQNLSGNLNLQRPFLESFQSRAQLEEFEVKAKFSGLKGAKDGSVWEGVSKPIIRTCLHEK